MWGGITGLCGFPIFFVLAHFGYPDKGLIAALSFVVIVAVCRIAWRIRRRPWFWPIVGALIAIHVIAVILVHFPRAHFIILYVFPIFFLDFIALYTIFWFTERRFGGRKAQKG